MLVKSCCVVAVIERISMPDPATCLLSACANVDEAHCGGGSSEFDASSAVAKVATADHKDQLSNERMAARVRADCSLKEIRRHT